MANLNLLIAFVHYTKGQEIKEFLSCKQLMTAKAIDKKIILNDFFTSNGNGLNGNGLLWNMVSAVCTDGALVRLGYKSGLRGLIKSDPPCITFTHCI